jgi:long-chain acyl-CoA synthetase
MQNNSMSEYQIKFEAFIEQERHLALMILSRVYRWGDSKTAVKHKPYGEWISYTWAEFGEQIDAAAMALLSMGVKEKEMVGIFADNRVEWSIADLAAMSIGAVSVPIYGTNSAKETQYIIEDAQIRILFSGNRHQYEISLSLLGTAAYLENIVVIDRDITLAKSDKAIHFDDFLAMGRQSGQQHALKAARSQLGADDLATLIYTSGTTGEPKGAMLTHRNILSMVFDPDEHLTLGPDDVSLAFLPLSHVFERAWTYFTLLRSAENHYCHDTKAILEFLRESRPMYMCSVPRMWEKIYAKVKEGVHTAPMVKKILFNWAVSVGGRVAVSIRDQKPVPVFLSFQHKLADKLVLGKIRAIFGGRNKIFNCGGAAFSAEIAEFFFNTGVLLLQGYGLTECFPICIANESHNKFGTCGPVLPLVNVRVTPEGEIQASGPAVMQGYYNKPELTQEMFTEDGWIKTGDIGTLDAEGYLTITDRIKDMMKTSGGKYIAPQHIETLLKEDLFMDQAAVVGDGRKYVSALIVPSFEPLEKYATEQGISFSSRDELLKNPKILGFYRERIDYRTRHLGQVEKVKKFALLSREFSQEKRELTPTQKIRRKVVNDHFKDIIETLYPDG